MSCPQSGGFDPAETVRASATQLGRSSIFAAPTMVKRLSTCAGARRSTARAFKTIVYGGGPMYVGTSGEALRGDGPALRADLRPGREPDDDHRAVARAHLRDARIHAGSSASPRSAWRRRCVEVRIADAEGNELPRGEIGEILVRGDTVMLGYWRNPEATAKALRDGWLLHRRHGRLDADGFLTLKDRSKDMIISRRLQHLSARGRGSAAARTRPCAKCRWSGGRIPNGARTWWPSSSRTPARTSCRGARRTVPASTSPASSGPRATVRRALPKNNYGKVLKTELREQLKEKS